MRPRQIGRFGSPNWSVGWIPGWSVSWIPGWSVGWIPGWSVSRFPDWSVSRFPDWSVGWIPGWSVGWIPGWSVVGWIPKHGFLIQKFCFIHFLNRTSRIISEFLVYKDF